MANSFQDITLVLTPLGASFQPQTLAASGNGRAVRVNAVGTDRLNARLLLGAASALTSLDVKLQATPDTGAGAPDGAKWVDIPSLNTIAGSATPSTASFPTVTAGDTGTSLVPTMVVFQLPIAVAGQRAYEWVRAVATLVGTNILMAVDILACRKYDGVGANVPAPGNAGSNLIN